MAEVKIGDTMVGDGRPCFIVAEIGINHNGDIDIAKKLIDLAKLSGCDAVKFQKRNPDFCVPLDQRQIMRETPWGYIPYFEYRKKVEFDFSQYQEIDAFCLNKKIPWFASAWDESSVDFMEQFDLPFYKIASASMTDDSLLKYVRSKNRPIILSTGMSTLEEVDHAVEILGCDNLILLHACSAYPAYYNELNLKVIPMFKKRYGLPVGYSGHETGIASSVAAVALGACVVERHVTLDRSMWGSDHAASLEPNGINRLVRDIRLVEMSMGEGLKKVVPREIPIMQRLRLSKNR